MPKQAQLPESAWSALGEEKSILAGDLLQNTKSEEGILKVKSRNAPVRVEYYGVSI